MAKPMVTTAAASMHSATNWRTWLRGRSLMFAQPSRECAEERSGIRRDQRVLITIAREGSRRRDGLSGADVPLRAGMILPQIPGSPFKMRRTRTEHIGWPLTPRYWAVGAGPVGLLMAAELNRHGVSCRIVDKNDGPTRTTAVPLAFRPGRWKSWSLISLADEFVQVGKHWRCRSHLDSRLQTHQIPDL